MRLIHAYLQARNRASSPVPSARVFSKTREILHRKRVQSREHLRGEASKVQESRVEDDTDRNGSDDDDTEEMGSEQLRAQMNHVENELAVSGQVDERRGE